MGVWQNEGGYICLMQKTWKTESLRFVKMVFDIQRDSIARKDSTFIANGKEYAKVELIVSRTSKNYDGKWDFAELLHTKIEQKHPGFSRGVLVKNGKAQSTYNQDLIGESVLMNIGGIDNTLEEEYRTADILATIIKELIETN